MPEVTGKDPTVSEDPATSPRELHDAVVQVASMLRQCSQPVVGSHSTLTWFVEPDNV